MKLKEEILHHEVGETLAKVAQRGGRCHLPGRVQGQVGWSSEQADLLEDVAAHGRGFGLDGLQRSLPTKSFLWFYVPGARLDPFLLWVAMWDLLRFCVIALSSALGPRRGVPGWGFVLQWVGCKDHRRPCRGAGSVQSVPCWIQALWCCFWGFDLLAVMMKLLTPAEPGERGTRIITRKPRRDLQQNCSPCSAGCAARLGRTPRSSLWLKGRNCRVSVFLHGGLSAGVCEGVGVRWLPEPATTWRPFWTSALLGFYFSKATAENSCALFSTWHSARLSPP